MDATTLDKRFLQFKTDPKFRRRRKKREKLKIDRRFHSMFTDEKFKVDYTVDKRGRPFFQSTKEDFKEFYGISSEEDTDKDEVINKQSSEVQESIPDHLILKEAKNKSRYTKNEVQKKLSDLSKDYARGECNLFSESSSDEPESEESEEEEIEHKWGELDNDAGRSDDVTSRLAICNMDWDRIRAEDLMVLLNSFLPSDGIIHSVTIYPSEFGLKRMAMEEVNGPTELVTRNNINKCSESDTEEEDEIGENEEKEEKDSYDDDSNEEEEEGKSYHRECLRQYQLNRLKYYYAVVVFDSPNTADKIYKECDNLEYESSATRLDLRFIPDDVVFDQEPKDKCEQLPDLTKYNPRCFTNTALQQVKVELTWDETDPARQEFTQKVCTAAKSGDIDDNDVKNYVALSSDSEELDSKSKSSDSEPEDTVEESSKSKEDPISKYRNLLKEIESEQKKGENDVQLEITWGSSATENKDEDNKRQEYSPKSDMTPFQKLLEKKKEKKKERKKHKKLMSKMNDDGSSDEIHFDDDASETDVKSKSKSKKNRMLQVTGDTEEEKRRQGELELLLMDDKGDHKRHFSLKKIKEKESTRRRRKRKEKLKEKDKKNGDDDFQVDVQDKRFEAIYSSRLYNIDPTDPKFHRTKGMEAFITEKRKRKAIDSDDIDTSGSGKARKFLKNESVELSL